jgi:uracil-DNA glycosylase
VEARRIGAYAPTRWAEVWPGKGGVRYSRRVAGAPSKIDIIPIRDEALTCVRCPLSQSRTQVVWADGNLDADVMIIGEAPGFHEDQEGKPFVGAAGQLLDRLLGEVDLDRSKVAIVNVLKCRPPGNRDPLPSEIEACKPYLQAQLAYMQPKVIITLGNFATKFILEDPTGITKARGRRYVRNGSVIVPTFHPAAALRGGRFGGLSPTDAIREDLQIVRRVLDELRPKQEPVAVGSADTEQLGLF